MVNSDLDFTRIVRIDTISASTRYLETQSYVVNSECALSVQMYVRVRDSYTVPLYVKFTRPCYSSVTINTLSIEWPGST